MTAPLPSFNLQRWIAEHQGMLKPPVGAQMLWTDAQLQVLVVGGPNARRDFHINPSDEFFFQLEGTIILEYMDAAGARQCQPIGPGDVFLLPALVPHSPQRPASSIGLVVERRRESDETEGYAWYCEACNSLVYRMPRLGRDLLADLRRALDEFHASESLRMCKRCGSVQDVPTGPRL